MNLLLSAVTMTAKVGFFDRKSADERELTGIVRKFALIGIHARTKQKIRAPRGARMFKPSGGPGLSEQL
jgi:hypothetical protein